MENSTILMLGYFKDILANVGLPEAWLEYDSNDVTRIKNNCVKRESNRTIQNLIWHLSNTVSQISLVKLSQIQPKTGGPIDSGNMSQIPSKTFIQIES